MVPLAFSNVESPVDSLRHTFFSLFSSLVGPRREAQNRLFFFADVSLLPCLVFLWHGVSLPRLETSSSFTPARSIISLGVDFADSHHGLFFLRWFSEIKSAECHLPPLIETLLLLPFSWLTVFSLFFVRRQPLMIIVFGEAALS